MKVCTPLPGIPLNLFDRVRELYRDIRWKRGYWTFWWKVRTFWWRRRQSKQFRELVKALEARSYNARIVKVNPSVLKVESLQPTMTVVTFDPVVLKFTT